MAGRAKKSSSWLEALGVAFAGISVLIAIAELTAKRCPDCGQKIVVVNGNLYCNRCNVYRYQ